MTETKQPALFSRDNYMWMLIGVAMIAVGMLLMAGGKSSDPNVFDANEVYSARRITVAPLLILAWPGSGDLCHLQESKNKGELIQLFL
ncbi:MAG: DUF3098 domain-containing protein [Chitinophagaceae bacterium]